MLTPERRKQLDDIVLKMASQNAPQKDVQAIVSDFVGKFNNEKSNLLPTQNFGNEPQGTAAYLPGEAANAASGIGKGVIQTAQDSSDLINEIASLIPQSLHEPIKQAVIHNPALMPIATALGLTSQISPGISKLENTMGQTPGSLTKTNNPTEAMGKIVGQAGSALFPAEGAAEAVAGGASKLAEKFAAQEALNAVRQEARFMTPTAKEAAIKTSGGLLKRAEPIITAEDQRLATKFQPLLDKGSNIVKENNMKSYLNDRTQEMTEYLTQNNFTFTNKELRTKLTSALNDVFPEGVKEATKKEAIDTLMSKIDKNTLLEAWKGRSKFDRVIENLFEKDTPLAGDIKKATRDAMNNFIEAKIPDSVYKAKLKDMSDAFRVLDRLSPKAAKDLGKTTLTQVVKKFTQKHPVITKAAEYTAAGAIAKKTGLFK